MAEPDKYSRTYSFTDYQSGNPAAPLPGVQVDNELENIEQSIGEAIDALGDIRRSDGKLNNGVVTVDSLDAQVAAGVGTGALASAAAAAASADASSDSAVASAASASAAAGSATTASGYAGNALTSRNEASGFADDSAAAASLSQTARDYANKWATEAEDVNVDDGVNPVGRSAYHWSQKAAASAASVGLPSSLTANTVPVTNAGATAREDKTFAEFFDLVVTDGSLDNAKLADVPTATLKGRATDDTGPVEDLTTAQARDLLDPLRGIANDGSVLVDDEFDALELDLVGRDIDCKGGVYKVSAIPTGNNYKYGFWAKSNGEAVNPKDVLYPMEGTFRAQSYKLTTGKRNDAWPQDKWHEIDGVIFAVWNQGTSHTADDLHPVMARSYDGGRTFVEFERLFQSRSFTAGVTSWSAGHCDGQQFIFVRQGDPASAHRLYCRRIGQVKKVNAQIISAAGSTEYIFSYPTHGVRSGNKIKLSANVSIGGITLLAGTEYSVNRGVAAGFYFTGPTATTSETLAAADYVVEFVESGWTEINWSGVAVGQHLINTNADQTSMPTMFHSFAGVPASGGTFYTCTHGGTATAGPTLLQFTGMLGNSPTLAKYNKITTASRVEATVCYDPSDGYLYGFARTQFTDNSPLAWWSSDAGTTFNTNIGGPVGALQYSPFPCKIKGDTIYAYGSANRSGTDDVSGQYVKGDVPLYLFRGDKTAFRTQYWAALQMIDIASAYKYSDWAGLNAVGVGSMVLLDDKLILVHSTDNEDNALGHGRPDIEYIMIELGADDSVEQKGIQRLAGRGVASSVPSLAMYDELHVENLKGSSGTFAKALIKGSDGTLYGGHGLTVSRTTNGTYAITWPSTGVANHVFAVAHSRNGSGYAQALSVTATGCQVLTKAIATDTLTDYDFQIEVSYISDWTRTEWT